MTTTNSSGNKVARSIKDLAQEAYDVQDACNLGGVLRGAVRAFDDLRALHPELGTDGLRSHPLMALWADKIAHLTDTQYDNTAVLSRAYEWAFGLDIKKRV